MFISSRGIALEGQHVCKGGDSGVYAARCLWTLNLSIRGGSNDSVAGVAGSQP